MIPDFSRKTTDTLAKRAAFLCSNPDCRVLTVGPNEEESKTTTLGEAAHISGARPNSARYDPKLTDAIRAEITNGIWLCRNCHRLVDADESRYSKDLLLLWRERHEEHIRAELGSKSDQIAAEIASASIAPFLGYPPGLRRIVLDRPPGWEYRLTAELLRHLASEHFREIRDIRDGLFNRPGTRLHPDEALDWLVDCMTEVRTLITPLDNLLDRLTASWGSPGVEGDPNEILRICALLSDAIGEVVAFEHRVNSTTMSDDYLEVKNLIAGHMGTQVLKLERISEFLDDRLERALQLHERGEGPLVETETISIEWPPGWNDRVDRALAHLSEGHAPPAEGTSLSPHEAKTLWKSILWLVSAGFVLYACVSS